MNSWILRMLVFGALLILAVVFVSFSLPNMRVTMVIEEPSTSGANRYIFPHQTAESWNSKSIDEMSDADLFEYMHWSDRASCYLSYDFGGIFLTSSNAFGIDGQKAVCMDKCVAPTPGKCFVYSFGINNEWSFDDMVQKLGCQVFAFDPSMGKEDHNRSANIHFFNLGLGNQDTDKGPNNWRIRTLPSIYQMLKPYHGDAPIDIVKMDIEKSEWQALPLLIESGLLDKVKQLAVEVHYQPDVLRENLKVLKKIEDYGMTRFALRVNNFNPPLQVLGRTDLMLYELAWFNRKYKNLTQPDCQH